MVIHTETGTWVKILKVTIREVNACNRVNIKRSNILVNCREQFFFFFPQNLTFSNTFLVFLIISLRFDLSRSGDSCTTPPYCKLSTTRQNSKQNYITLKSSTCRCQIRVEDSATSKERLKNCIASESLTQCAHTCEGWNWTCNRTAN